MKIKQKHKEQIFVEFKSKLLDRRFRIIKIKMLNEIKELEGQIIYSFYEKKDSVLKQSIKEKMYIQLLERIISSIENDFDIVFDEFGIKDFESRIIKRIKSYDHIKTVTPMNSQFEAGLKYVDNLCSVIRLHFSDEDENKFFDLIKDTTIEIL